VLRPDAIVELVWQDESGSTSATTLHCASSLTVIEIDVAATAVASILASMTGCVLIMQRIRYKTAYEPITLPAISTPITKVGAMFFSTEGDASDALIAIPAIKDAILVEDGPTAMYAIDLTNSDVIAFEDAVTSLPCSNPFGDTVIALVAAYLQSRV